MQNFKTFHLSAIFALENGKNERKLGKETLQNIESRFMQRFILFFIAVLFGKGHFKRL